MGKEFTCNAGDAGERSQTLGQEEPLDEGMAAHSSILAWKILSTESLAQEVSKGQAHYISEERVRDH